MQSYFANQQYEHLYSSLIFSRICVQADPQVRMAVPAVFCTTCGKEGHLARSCKEGYCGSEDDQVLWSILYTRMEEEEMTTAAAAGNQDQEEELPAAAEVGAGGDGGDEDQDEDSEEGDAEESDEDSEESDDDSEESDEDSEQSDDI